MTTMTTMLEHLRRTLQGDLHSTDGQLLGSYLEKRDEAAFAALVRRHGPMVWGVCRRRLDREDAEDAFQATFLVLVRKASTILPREKVASWLYGVANQTALHAQRTLIRRKAREKLIAGMPEPSVEKGPGRDLECVLDQELSRLPDLHREVIVLCDLEGKSRKETARQLGLPEGTVGSRLARARAMLAKRLKEQGVVWSAAASAAVLAQQASAGVPHSAVESTIKAAVGKAEAAVKVAALAEGVMRAMLLSKLKSAVAIVLILVLVSIGTTLPSYRPAAGQEKPVEPPAKLQEDLTAWGKAVGGLQAGLSIHPNQTFKLGDVITLTVRVRNVSKKTVKFEYLKQFLDENPPAVTDADGTPIGQRKTEVTGFHVPVEVALEPGQQIILESRIQGSGMRYELRPVELAGLVKAGKYPALTIDTGKISLQYERVLGDSSAGQIKLDPALSKLATGKLVLDAKESASKTERRGDEKRKEAAELLQGLSTADVDWDGQWIGIVAILRSEQAKRLAALGEPAIPELIGVLADKQKFTSAHAILTEIASGGHVDGLVAANGIVVNLPAEGPALIDPAQRFDLQRRWQKWYHCNPRPTDLPD